MDELGDNAQVIIEEIDDMKNRGYALSPQQRCEYCDIQLFDNQHHFYLFPCSHGFCADCLSARAEEVLLGKYVCIYSFMYLCIFVYVYSDMKTHFYLYINYICIIIYKHVLLYSYMYMYIDILIYEYSGDLDKLKYVRTLEDKIHSLGVRAHHNHGADKRAVTQVFEFKFIYIYIYEYMYIRI